MMEKFSIYKVTCVRGMGDMIMMDLMSCRLVAWVSGYSLLVS
jgi:hypothetical protein